MKCKYCNASIENPVNIQYMTCTRCLHILYKAKLSIESLIEKIQGVTL